MCMQVGDVLKYDISSEQLLDAQAAQRRLVEQLESSNRLGGTSDGALSTATQYIVPTPRRPRPRCFNCGSYHHALKVATTHLCVSLSEAVVKDFEAALSLPAVLVSRCLEGRSPAECTQALWAGLKKVTGMTLP